MAQPAKQRKRDAVRNLRDPAEELGMKMEAWTPVDVRLHAPHLLGSSLAYNAKASHWGPVGLLPHPAPLLLYF